MVIERVILLWVKNFKKSRGGVSMEIALTDFVDLVAVYRSARSHND